MSNPIVTFEMENGDVMKAELYPEIAPNTVNNFISLVKKGFYDGLIFHRVIPGFMIQGGDPKGVGVGGPGYSIKGEFSANGFRNDLKHDRGVLSMARAMQKCRRERIGVYLEVYKDACDRKRMNDIQNAVLASLVSVGLKCEYKRFPEHDVILLDDLVI